MFKYPVFTIMTGLLLAILLVALAPLVIDFGASLLTDHTNCRMGAPDKAPCLFLGFDWRNSLEQMHFFGWMVSLGLIQLAGISFLIWLGLAIVLAIIFRLRSKPPATPFPGH